MQRWWGTYCQPGLIRDLELFGFNRNRHTQTEKVTYRAIKLNFKGGKKKWGGVLLFSPKNSGRPWVIRHIKYVCF